MSETEQLPAFDDWESLFVEGAKAIVIVLVYQLPPLLVVGLSIGGLVVLDSNGGPGLVGVLVFLGGLLIAAVLWVLFGYLGIVAVLTFARERTLGAAFDGSAIRTVAGDTDFAITWLYGLGLMIGLNAVVGMVMFVIQLVAIIPIIGWIIAFLALFLAGPLSAAMSFYAQVVAYRVWGRGYAESHSPDTDDVGGEFGAGSTTSTPTAEQMSGRDVGEKTGVEDAG